MSEEEIKKNIDEIIDNYNTFLDDEEFGDYYEREWAEFELKTITAFLDLYNKEKKKNRTLEELLQGRLFELYKYYKDLASKYQGNCVSKDKIKPIQIIDLDGKIHNVYKIEEE